METHGIVVDSCSLIDVSLVAVGISPEKVGRPNRSKGVAAFLHSITHPWVCNGVEGTTSPVLSKHVGDMVMRHIPRHLPRGAGAEDVVWAGVRSLNVLDTVVFEHVQEDYRELAHAAFRHFGTDAEDEAVYACARRTGAVGILTSDVDFHWSLRNNRKFQVWNPDEFARAIWPGQTPPARR